jgi:hypothetical protein
MIGFIGKGRGRRFKTRANPVCENPGKIMRDRREQMENVKVRFECLPREASAEGCAKGLLQNRPSNASQHAAIISVDAVDEAKGAVAAKRFKNPMRGGCVLSAFETALSAVLEVSSLRGDPSRSRPRRTRTPATVVNTLRRKAI